MRFKGSYYRELLIIGVFVMVLSATSNAFAGPLYGGYNGESEAWIEVSIVEENRIGFSLKISVGADSDLNWWARFGISGLFLLPYNVSHIGFSYDVGDVISASFATLLPLPLQVGADSNALVWARTNFLVGVIGADSNGTIWEETGVPGVWARGEDTNDNQWRWLKVLPVLVGVEENFASNQGGSLIRFDEERRSLQNHFAKEYGAKISSLLVEKLTFPLDPFNGTPSELNALLGYVEEKILTDEIRDEMSILLDGFAQDIQPRLKAIKKMVAAP